MPDGDVLSPDSRPVPIRRLADDEADRLGYAGPLQLSRLQFGRFGWWRNSRWYVVETVGRERRMTVTAKELARYGIPIVPNRRL
jgi:hypothetical protein